ncbi:hypothetical protein SAGO17_0059 [Mimivirus AB-566-O17]|uniref:Uncharacterized protein n=1 Tax=Mimivirus AB-566-O17 TaxID=1988039 RepID=A0A1X9VNT9_9VIRU|nr:hypothetical protein SAGO17_0059 [Mimivirus AB-566-O17]
MDTSELIKFTRRTRFRNIPRRINELMQSSKSDYSSLNVAMYINPCEGGGDVSFAIRIWEYLFDWFGVSAYVFTTRPSTFIKSNKVPEHMLYCVRDRESREPFDCAVTKFVGIYSLDCKRRMKTLPVFDLFLVCPWVSEELFTYNTLSRVFKESNPFNTYIFSAYNQDVNSDDQNYDFVSGLGGDRLGLTFVDVPKVPFKFVGLGEYILVHVSKTDSIDPLDCVRSFLRTMLKKYKRSITFVLPRLLDDYPYLFKDLSDSMGVGIIVMSSDDTLYYGNTSGSVVYTMRTDILPVGLDDFSSLIINALPDFLMTGNQSVTDLLSLRESFTLYYQLMPWDKVFANQLRKLSDHKHISNKRLSCGNWKMSYDPERWERVREFDFRVLAYSKMSRIMELSLNMKRDKSLRRYVELYLGSRKKETFLRKLMD